MKKRWRRDEEEMKKRWRGNEEEMKRRWRRDEEEIKRRWIGYEECIKRYFRLLFLRAHSIYRNIWPLFSLSLPCSILIEYNRLPLYQCNRWTSFQRLDAIPWKKDQNFDMKRWDDIRFEMRWPEMRWMKRWWWRRRRIPFKHTRAWKINRKETPSVGTFWYCIAHEISLSK